MFRQTSCLLTHDREIIQKLCNEHCSFSRAMLSNISLTHIYKSFSSSRLFYVTLEQRLFVLLLP